MMPIAVAASLRYAGSIDPWWVYALAIILAGVAGVFYLRETRHLQGSPAYLLPALRATAIFLVVLILAGPVWHRETTVGVLGRVIFAVDTSASMSLTDSADQQSPDRLGRIIERLVGNRSTVDNDGRGWLEKLSQTHLIDVVAFDNGPLRTVWSSAEGGELPLSFDLKADGQSTDLSSPLRQAAASANSDAVASDAVDSDSQNKSPADADSSKDSSDTPPTAVVILSDGRDTSEDRSTDLSELTSHNVVHTIGIGSPDEPADLGITRVDFPETVAVDGRLAGKVEFKRIGFDGSLRLRIETSQGKTVWQQDVSDSAERSIDFEIDVAELLNRNVTSEDRGVVRTTEVLDLRAVIEGGFTGGNVNVGSRSATATSAPVNPENASLMSNDRREFRVAAAVRDRRLLLIDGSSRWETRYLRNLFSRDPSYEVDTIIAGSGTDHPTFDRGDKPGQMPSTETAMNRYDAIVLGEISGDLWTKDDYERLDQFVSRGGGLVMIDGQYDRLRGVSQGSLASLIPVEVSSRRIEGIKSVVPTAVANDLPMLDLTGAAGEIESIWKALPAPTSITRVTSKPGSEVWLQADSMAGEEHPFLVTRMYGSGRVFYFAGDQSWRWRYKVADQLHARFWNQLLSAAMQPPYSASDDFVSLATDKIQYPVGQSPLVRTRLRDASGRAVGDTTVDAVIMSEGEIVTTVPMEVDNAARGTYRGSVPSLVPGRYEVKIRAGGFDTRALRASTPFWVGGQPSEEWNQLSVDTNNLKNISKQGGGVHLSESSADEILKSLQPLSTGRIISTDHILWQSFWWFAAVLALLGAEWYLRKKASLV
jgi:uncharacterized membrane protein